MGKTHITYGVDCLSKYDQASECSLIPLTLTFAVKYVGTGKQPPIFKVRQVNPNQLVINVFYIVSHDFISANQINTFNVIVHYYSDTFVKYFYKNVYHLNEFNSHCMSVFTSGCFQSFRVVSQAEPSMWFILPNGMGLDKNTMDISYVARRFGYIYIHNLHTNYEESNS